MGKNSFLDVFLKNQKKNNKKKHNTTLICLINLSCIVCNFWSSNFGKKVFIFQKYSKNAQIQVNILPFS